MAPAGAITGDDRYAGTLFDGTKFFLHQQVPQRTEFIQLIKANGGRTVFENVADVKIGDHARKNVPPGFISWKYIEDSIKKGELRNIDDYQIGKPTSAQPAKSTRQPFTHEEDERLTKYVEACLNRGEYGLGNAIYIAFAENNPTHPWQSWRDRWLKKLSLEHKGHLPNPGSSSTPAPPLRVVTDRPRRVSPISDESPPQDRRASRKVRVPFTPEDDKILRKWVKKHDPAGIRERGNAIYQDLENEHPHHTFHSWRDRWLKYVRNAAESSTESDSEPTTSKPTKKSLNPKKGGLNTQNTNQASRQKGTLVSPSPQPVRHPRGAGVSETPGAPVQAPTPHGNALGSRSDSRASPSVSKTSSASTQGPKRLRIRDAAEIIQRVWRGYYVRQQLRQLKEYFEQKGVEQIPWVNVGPKVLGLWDLWQAVKNSEQTMGYPDWELVAESLDLEWSKDRDILNQLQSAFDQNLGEFKALMDSFMVEDDEPTVEVPSSQVTSDDISEHFVSSPPVVSLKRSPQDTTHAMDGVSTPSKRRRYSRSEVIPCTPSKVHQKVGTSPGDRLLTSSAMIRSNGRLSSQQLPFPSATVYEPETQDFRFGTPLEVEADCSPSEQLRSETSAEMASVLHREEGSYRQAGQASSSQIVTSSRQNSGIPAARKFSSLSKTVSPPGDVDSDSDEYFATPVARKIVTASQDLSKRPVTHKTPLKKATNPALDRIQRGPLRAAQRTPDSTRQPSATPRRPAAEPDPGGSITREGSEAERFESMGYSKDEIVRALKATTGDADLVKRVMENLSKGHDIPEQEAVEWSKKDLGELAAALPTDISEEAERRVANDWMKKEKIRWSKMVMARCKKTYGEESYEQKVRLLRSNPVISSQR